MPVEEEDHRRDAQLWQRELLAEGVLYDVRAHYGGLRSVGHRLDLEVVLPQVSRGRWASIGGGPIQPTAALEIPLTSRKEALLHLLLNATWRLFTWDLVEEFCALRVWPLACGWSVELGDPKGDLPSLEVAGREGLGLCLGFSSALFLLFFILTRHAGVIVVMPIDKAA